MTRLLVEGLRKDMQDLRGHLRTGILLSDITWFRVGGAAEVLFIPADIRDLSYFLSHLPSHLPVVVIGCGSNLLVRDGGIFGVVIRLTGGFSSIELEPGCHLRIGAGARNASVARFAASAGIAGLSFLCGIPGSIGGALRMNCGAYGSELKDICIAARAVTRSGELVLLSGEEMGFGYRYCAASEDFVFVEALLQGHAGVPDDILCEMEQITHARSTIQPVHMRTSGSTFKNPSGYKAWQLIDQAQCRGIKLGGAQVSELHCNFLINTGNATAEDIENLGECVRQRVKEASGIDLEWEIKRIGDSVLSK